MTSIGTAVRAGAGVAAAMTLLAFAGPSGVSGSRDHDSARTADIVAIEATQACYGRAQDVVYRNYADEAKAKREAHAAFAGCFTGNAHVDIGFFGAEPSTRTTSIDDWIDFVFQFGQDHGYLSTRHLIGNVQVVFTGRDTATVYSAGLTPHFIGAGKAAETPGVDWITGNYRGEVRRISGRWLITDFRINADEVAHTSAGYPNGRSDGSGNIGFPDYVPGPAAGTRS